MFFPVVFGRCLCTLLTKGQDSPSNCVRTRIKTSSTTEHWRLNVKNGNKKKTELFIRKTSIRLIYVAKMGSVLKELRVTLEMRTQFPIL